jgi:deoxyribonuclease-4
MTIYLGTAGVPGSARDRSTIGGIQRVAELGLNAMEVEFVRGVKMSPELAAEAGRVAKENNVRLSVHAPYFVNLLSPKHTVVEASMQRILDSLDRGERMGADAVAVHAAYYGELTSEEAMKMMNERIGELIGRMEKCGVKKIKLGLEVMAKHGQWGSLEEAIYVYKSFSRRVVPYIDWGHLFARCNGNIDYAEVLDKIKKAGLIHINSHFTCVRRGKIPGTYVDIHEPVMRKAPDFRPLAKELAKGKTDITLICETPLLEDDALEMKKQVENFGYNFG